MNKENREPELRFQSLFVSLVSKVKRFSMLLLKSETEADDVAQEVFMKLWSRPDVWKMNDKSIDDYVFIMTRNEIFNILRHKKVTGRYKESVYDESVIRELTDGRNIYDGIYCHEIMLLVRLHLEKMPQKRREIFEASRFRGMSNKEIAQKYGISVRTVEHQIYLALGELKKILHVLIFFLSTISVTSVFN